MEILTTELVGAAGTVGSVSLGVMAFKIRSLFNTIEEMKKERKEEIEKVEAKITNCVMKELCLLQHTGLKKSIKDMDDRNEKGHDTIFKELRNLQTLIIDNIVNKTNG